MCGALEIGSGLLSNTESIPTGKGSEVAILRMGFPQGAPITYDKKINQK